MFTGNEKVLTGNEGVGFLKKSSQGFRGTGSELEQGRLLEMKGWVFHDYFLFAVTFYHHSI